MKRAIVLSILLLLLVTYNLTSLVYLENGETAINMGLNSNRDSATVVSIISLRKDQS